MYRLYLDEVGTDGLNHLDVDKHRYLSLSGVVMKLGTVNDDLTRRINDIKFNIIRHDPDEPINLHRSDVVGRKGPFEILRDTTVAAHFDAALINIFRTADYRVITVIIDKAWMLRQKHWKNRHPYHWLMEVLVEKYALFLKDQDTIGDIMPESRGKKKDGLLQEAYSEVRNSGTYYVPANEFQQRLRASKLKFRTKKDNVSGLQLCDMIAHPSHMFCRHCDRHPVELGPFARRVSQILAAEKYHRSARGRVIGYGMKRFP
ncbi:DUF3800 domain-containing protein [Henriciella marina]|uniref:DUF3800 domain-containing protein n=1 Tax=Henriciella marina TaxID=453851 RepID=A0ABT4LWB4_9PROT|nr:DUF3800 domain-containing protein [Henriciella marina]MCZ4298657.1 DUF3800 domain-containing protein [Henriciella marina]